MSTTILDQATALAELAALWDGHAEAQKRYDPNDPKAKTLERCASDLRRIAKQHAPEWVPIGVVEATSGLSRTTLIRRCKELEVDSRARKRGDRWEIAIEAALELAKSAERTEIRGTEDVGDLARILGRDPGR